MERLSGEVSREQIVNDFLFGISNSAIHPNCRLWGKFHHDLSARPTRGCLIVRRTVQVNSDDIEETERDGCAECILFSAHDLLPVRMFDIYASDQASIGQLQEHADGEIGFRDDGQIRYVSSLGEGPFC